MPVENPGSPIVTAATRLRYRDWSVFDTSASRFRRPASCSHQPRQPDTPMRSATSIASLPCAMAAAQTASSLDFQVRVEETGSFAVGLHVHRSSTSAADDRWFIRAAEGERHFGACIARWPASKASQLADRHGLFTLELGDQGAPCGVGKRGKGAVERGGLILNHVVKFRSAGRCCQLGRMLAKGGATCSCFAVPT